MRDGRGTCLEHGGDGSQDGFRAAPAASVPPGRVGDGAEKLGCGLGALDSVVAGKVQQHPPSVKGCGRRCQGATVGQEAEEVAATVQPLDLALSALVPVAICLHGVLQ